MKVPFNDLNRIHDPIREELNKVWKDITRTNSYILGEPVKHFETKFAKYCGFESELNAAGVSTGTDALELILRSLDIGKGDEVITVSHTFNATGSAIQTIGATPIFVEVNPNTYLIDSNGVEEKLTSRTKAIIPVHLYGQQADTERIVKIANSSNKKIYIIEDACQAHGSLRNGHHPGHYGDAAAFSFYPGKNLGAFGDAGIVLSKNLEIIEKVKKFRNYGQAKKYDHQSHGFNKRLDGLQAAILDVKLDHLNEWNKSRREAAKRLTNNLSRVVDIITPREETNNSHVYHLYVVLTKRRDELSDFLRKNGIETGIHYPVPLHKQKELSRFHKGKAPLYFTEKIAEQILSLPIFPYMRTEEIDYVSDNVKKFFK